MSLVVLAIENRRWCRRSYVHNCDFWSNLSRVGLESRRTRNSGKAGLVIRGKSGSRIFMCKKKKKLLAKESHCDRHAEISKRNVEACHNLQNTIRFWLPRFRFWALHYWLKLSVETIAFRSWLRKGRRCIRERLKKCNSQSQNLALLHLQ